MESKVDTFTLTFTKGQEEMEAKVGKPLAEKFASCQCTVWDAGIGG